MTKLETALQDLEFASTPPDGTTQVYIAHGSRYNSHVLVSHNLADGSVEIAVETDDDAPVFRAHFSKWDDVIADMIATLVK